MKKLFLILFLLPVIAMAQNDFKLLKSLNGIEVYARMSKNGETKKNNKYVVEVMYKNATSEPIYYSSLPKESKTEEPTEEFARVTFASVTNIFSSSALYLFGDPTKLSMSGNKIYQLLPGKEYNKVDNFVVKKGVEPILIANDSGIQFKSKLQDFL